MLLVSPTLDFRSLKLGQGCIAMGREQFKLNRNLDWIIQDSLTVFFFSIFYGFPINVIKFAIEKIIANMEKVILCNRKLLSLQIHLSFIASFTERHSRLLTRKTSDWNLRFVRVWFLVTALCLLLSGESLVLLFFQLLLIRGTGAVWHPLWQRKLEQKFLEQPVLSDSGYSKPF